MLKSNSFYNTKITSQNGETTNMHTFGETGAGVPAFLAKLWRLVDDPQTDDLICWNKDGCSFFIRNQAQFARELLPLNYKHNNMASFIRQLNMYGFHKITSIDNGGLKFDRDEMEFIHPCFQRKAPHKLELIKRKIATSKSAEEKANVKPDAVNRVLQDVKAMRGRQDSLDTRFSVMKQENEALWREIASLRQKHAKQQQIVNKLIQFLITIVQPSRNMTTVKRHMQLMINDIPEHAKLRTASESDADCGPVIRELGEELLDEVTDPDPELMDPNSPYNRLSSVHTDNGSPSPLHMERPHSSISQVSQNFDYSNLSSDDVLNAAGTAQVAGSNGSPINFLRGSPSLMQGTSSVIQSVEPDGSQIYYHVTEVPDIIPSETVANGIEEDVVTTPLVRQEMARSQMMKHKNKQRRKGGSAAHSVDSMDVTTPKMMRFGRQTPQQQQQQQQQQQRQQQPTVATSVATADGQLNIKGEFGDVNPMIFLNTNPDGRMISPDSQLISPNISEDSRQSGINANLSGGMVTSTTPTNDNSLMGTSANLFNPNDMISDEMPVDLFEDSSLLGGGGENGAFDSPQQFTSSGKFSSFMANNKNPTLGGALGGKSAVASTSGPTSTTVLPSLMTSSNGGQASTGAAGTGPAYGKKIDNGNMAVAKYKSAPSGQGEVMRLSTAEEVSGHLETVQDELDSLKDLLRGEGYQLDANTLLGLGTSLNNMKQLGLMQSLDDELFNKLFNDSDILGPYGSLPWTNDSSNEKKGNGSELMTYQSPYDLTDIINNSRLGLGSPATGNGDTPSSSSRQIPSSPSSVLNTPKR